MLVQITSDLHQEFCYSILHNKKADIIIIAGDLNYVECLERTLRTLRNQFSCILFVPGNHEYYHHSIASTNEMLKDIAIPNVHILNRSIHIINDIVFIGAVGWPDHSYKEAFVGGHTHFISKQKNNDWNFIKKFNSTYKVEGQEDALFIREMLKKYAAHKCVVITHFVPLPECRGNRNFHITDAAFINNYASWCFTYPPVIWIHGHSHSYFNRTLGDTVFIRNPFGYVYKGDYFDYQDTVIDI